MMATMDYRRYWNGWFDDERAAVYRRAVAILLAYERAMEAIDREGPCAPSPTTPGGVIPIPTYFVWYDKRGAKRRAARDRLTALLGRIGLDAKDLRRARDEAQLIHERELRDV